MLSFTYDLVAVLIPIQMIRFQKDLRLSRRASRLSSAPTPSRRVVITSSRAVEAQQSGLDRFNSLRKSSSRSSVDSSDTSTEASEVTDDAETERRACLEDETIVDRQLNKYEDEGIVDHEHPEWSYFKLDLIKYWSVCTRRLTLSSQSI